MASPPPTPDELRTLANTLRWFRARNVPLPLHYRMLAEDALQAAGHTLTKRWTAVGILELALRTAAFPKDHYTEALLFSQEH